jgi:hypothetical protein
MKRTYILTLTALSLLLTACGGTDDDPLARNCEWERTSVEQFSLCLGEGWGHRTEQFESKGSFIVYINDSTGTGSLMQIHVKKDPLEDKPDSDMAFAERAVEVARQSAPNYQAVTTDPIVIDTRNTLLHIFDASPDSESPSVRYYQFVTTNGNIAYGFTAIMLPTTNEELKSTLLGIFTNVRFL